MTFKSDRNTAYDSTYEQGCPYAAIVCACGVRVLYNPHASTRPIFCPKHESSRALDDLSTHPYRTLSECVFDLRKPNIPLRKTIQIDLERRVIL
jgi:hypothetical protein